MPTAATMNSMPIAPYPEYLGKRPLRGGVDFSGADGSIGSLALIFRSSLRQSPA